MMTMFVVRKQQSPEDAVAANLVRKSLLLAETIRKPSSVPTLEVQFSFENRDEANNRHCGGQRKSLKPDSDRTGAGKRVSPAPSAGSVRMTRSEKKKQSKMADISSRNPGVNSNLPQGAAVTSGRVLVHEALRKIRSFGLLMREMRDGHCVAPLSAAPSSQQQESLCGKDDESVLSVSCAENNKERIVAPRKESILEAFDNITTFVQTLMKDDATEAGKGTSENTIIAMGECKCDVERRQRLSSFYSSLSDGSLTEEEVDTQNDEGESVGAKNRQ